MTTSARILALGVWILPIAMAESSPDAICAKCHADIAARFRETAMAKALAAVTSCDILHRHPDLTFREAGYESRIRREGDRSVLTVSGSGKTLTIPLLWAFGRGEAGQTYVFELNGAYYESRASFYNALGGLDLTMGAQTVPKTIEDAAGHRLGIRDAIDCFGCHSAGGAGRDGLHLDSLIPGVGCVSCHAGAAAHATAVGAGAPNGPRMQKLSTLPAEELSELCGRCHRTWSQIATGGPRGVLNVRFQPYRLTNSRCYDVTDARIRCSACHDPHGALEKSAAAYDSRCAACHSSKLHTRTCSVAKERCVSCHMPKIELPGAHAKFTDHQIRIARAGDPYPN
jgi:hypothetical protein